jgi:hypothetical protein
VQVTREEKQKFQWWVSGKMGIPLMEKEAPGKNRLDFLHVVLLMPGRNTKGREENKYPI